MTNSILIADDHEIIRIGLRSLLEGSRFNIVSEASSGAEVLRKIETHRPEIVLMDVRMPLGDGIHVLSRLRLEQPQVIVLLISAYDNPVYLSRAAAIGAAGFLLKSISRNQLIEALETAIRDRTIWTRDELRRVTSAMAAPRLEVDLDVPLTQRECDVLRQLANGKSNQQIADSLTISYETAKEHVQNVLRKIGVANRTQAAVWAVRKNLA